MVTVKTLADLMNEKGYIFKSVNEIDKKILGSRKKIDIFMCVDRKSYYHIVFITMQKSRFLLKNAEEILALEEKIKSIRLHNNKYKHLFVKEQMCSKAKSFLQEQGWSIYNDFM
jgi:hypothetical protein